MIIANTPLRLAFMGSPDFAVPILAALLDAGHEIACVYAQPPRPAGRGHKERHCSVHAEALARGLDVRTVVNFKAESDRQDFVELDLDAAVVAAYGLILPADVLAAPRLGCFNAHASLLPRWRGAAPIQRAILAGDAITGVTVMGMEESLDTGPMFATAEVTITARTTAEDLHDTLANLGGPLMVSALDGIAAGTLSGAPQPNACVTYAPKLEKAEGRIDWSISAAHIERLVRGLNPWPGVWFEHEGQRIKVLGAHVTEHEGPAGTVVAPMLTVACGHGAIGIDRLQRPGKGPMTVADYLRGNPINVGTKFG